MFVYDSNATEQLSLLLAIIANSKRWNMHLSRQTMRETNTKGVRASTLVHELVTKNRANPNVRAKALGRFADAPECCRPTLLDLLCLVSNDKDNIPSRFISTETIVQSALRFGADMTNLTLFPYRNDDFHPSYCNFYIARTPLSVLLTSKDMSNDNRMSLLNSFFKSLSSEQLAFLIQTKTAKDEMQKINGLEEDKSRHDPVIVRIPLLFDALTRHRDNAPFHAILDKACKTLSPSDLQSAVNAQVCAYTSMGKKLSYEELLDISDNPRDGNFMLFRPLLLDIGNTPFHEAIVPKENMRSAYTESLKVMKKLSLLSADKTIRNARGLTPYLFSVEQQIPWDTDSIASVYTQDELQDEFGRSDRSERTALHIAIHKAMYAYNSDAHKTALEVAESTLNLWRCSKVSDTSKNRDLLSMFLYQAVMSDDICLCEILVRHGASPRWSFGLNELETWQMVALGGASSYPKAVARTIFFDSDMENGVEPFVATLNKDELAWIEQNAIPTLVKEIQNYLDISERDRMQQLDQYNIEGDIER